ncbi:cytochrome c oxidase subunit II, partial [Bacteroidota bacterium]
MLALFYIFIAVAVALGIWQVNKLLSFTKKTITNDKNESVTAYIVGEENPIATEKNNDLHGKFFLAFLIGFYILMGYCLFFLNDIMLPESASIEGENDDNLFLISFILIGIVQFATQALLFGFSYKYRGVNDRKALFYADSHKLELIWTTIPTIVLTGLIGYGLYTWNTVMDLSDVEDPILIEVYAKQFSWEARYAGADKTLGRGDVRNIQGINTMGVDLKDPNGADDVPVRELHLPVGRKVVFKFRSQDVLHSAYMPHFRAQMNCVPGMVTEFGFTPKFTTEQMRLQDETVIKVDGINKIRKEKGEDPYVFDFLLLCNKICGASHYNMQMKIVVEEEAAFNSWLKEQP